MGSKSGYAGAILRCLGLRSGQGADRYLWCEPDDGCRALLEAYTRPDVLAEAAAIIRGWKDEDPRALWERLRAEGPIKGCEAREVGRWLLWTAGTTGGQAGAGGFKGAHCLRPNVDGFIPSREGVAGVLDAFHCMPATLTPDARPISPIPGAVVFIDPPYVGTTGYGHDLTRAEVCDMADRWATAGATVVISEAEPIEALGWHHVEITGERVGQKRTFSKQQREWLTVSKAPVWTPAVQRTLWEVSA